MFKPLPHPATECPFYRGGWQNFLVATQPDAHRQARAGLDLPDHRHGLHAQDAPDRHALVPGRRQAGRSAPDPDRSERQHALLRHPGQPGVRRLHPRRTAWTTSKAIQAYPSDRRTEPDLPAGRRRVQVRLADGRGRQPTIAAADPELHQHQDHGPDACQTPTRTATSRSSRTAPCRSPVTVRLLAIHVVFTLPGHPEFVWASFEHSTRRARLRAPPTASATWRRRSPARTRATTDPTNHA